MKNLEILNQFFDKWMEEEYEYFKGLKKMGYQEKKELNLPKSTILLLERQLDPRQGCYKSIKEILEEYKQTRILKLNARIEKKNIGDIVDMDMHYGKDGTPNGCIKGTKGIVNIITILAWGNIQRPHYRVLVK